MAREVTLRPVLPHAEITALVVGEEQLDITVDAMGDELVARRRGGGEEARFPVADRRAVVPLADLASAGVWDLWLGERRVGRHDDGISNKKTSVVLPARRIGASELQPYFTVEDNLSVRVGPPAPTSPVTTATAGAVRERVVRPLAIAAHRAGSRLIRALVRPGRPDGF
jgi:hypothetical protein